MTETLIPLSVYQIRRLAVEAFANDRTVRKAYRDPSSVRESTRLRLAKAAQDLGFPTPSLPTLARLQ